MSFELTLIQIFLLGSSGGIFNHKNKFKEDWILQGTRKIIYTLQEAPRENINNLWPIGTEDLYSVIFSL